MTTGWAGESAQRARSPRIAGAIRQAVERWGFLAAVASMVATGVVLRFYRLGERVLSFDESYTVATAQRSFLEMLGAFRFEANGTLYALLLWPLIRISEAEAVVRMPALLAGLATIPAVYWVGRELSGHRAGLLGAAFVALSPALIGWSVYARGYAFANLFAVLSFGCLTRALQHDELRPGRWRALYVLATLALAYSSALAAVALLPVHAVAVAARARGTRALLPWARAALALALGSLPLLLLLYVESTYRDPLAWLWEPDFALVRRVGGELSAGPAYFGGTGAGLAALIGATSVGIVLAGLVLSRRARFDWDTRLLLGWSFFPPLLLLVASEVRPVFWGRYLGIIVPALALLLAVLLVRMPKAFALVYATALAAVLSIASLTATPPLNDFRNVAQHLEAERRASAPVVFYPIEQLPSVAYYASSLRIDGRIPVEEWNDTRLPAGLVGYRRAQDWGDSSVGPPTAADLARLASRTGSVMVVTYRHLADEIPVARAEAEGCLVEWFDDRRVLSVSGCPR